MMPPISNTGQNIENPEKPDADGADGSPDDPDDGDARDPGDVGAGAAGPVPLFVLATPERPFNPPPARRARRPLTDSGVANGSPGCRRSAVASDVRAASSLPCCASNSASTKCAFA